MHYFLYPNVILVRNIFKCMQDTFSSMDEYFWANTVIGFWSNTLIGFWCNTVTRFLSNIVMGFCSNTVTEFWSNTVIGFWSNSVIVSNTVTASNTPGPTLDLKSNPGSDDTISPKTPSPHNQPMEGRKR